MSIEPTLPPGKISNLSDSQERILNILSLISGSISVICSSTIIYLIMKSKRRSPLNRMLVGLSASDIIFSITYAVIPFLLPADTSTRVWAMGDDRTCLWGGFFVQLSFSTGWYNGFLSFYYLATVRFGVPPSTFGRRFEPWIHLVSVGWSLVSASIGVIFDYYRGAEIGQVCWVDGEIPKGCNADDSCVGMLIAWVFAGIWAAIFFVALVVNNLLVYCHVRKTFSRSKRRSLSAGQISYENRLKTVATQGFLFVASYLLSYTWTFATRILDAYGAIQPAREAQYFPLFVCQHFFLPLQGFFNLLIYYGRPKYLARREEFPDESVYSSLKSLAAGGLLATPIGGSGTNTSFNRSRSFNRGNSSWRQDARRGGKRSRDSPSGRRLSGGSFHTLGFGNSQHMRNVTPAIGGNLNDDVDKNASQNLEAEIKKMTFGGTGGNDQRKSSDVVFDKEELDVEALGSGNTRRKAKRQLKKDESSVLAEYESTFSLSSHHIGDDMLSDSSDGVSIAHSLVDILESRNESVFSTSSQTYHA